MKRQGCGSLILGGFLIILGFFLLSENFGWLGDLTWSLWSLVLGAAGVGFVAIVVGDRKQWWALIPGLVLIGVALSVVVGEQTLLADYVVGTVVLLFVGLPFFLIFLLDRKQWWALIPAFSLAGAAASVFLEEAGVIGGPAVAGVIMGGVSLGFVSVYVIDREQWWALIPGAILAFMALVMLLATAARYLWPLVIIAFGLLLLRSAVRGDRGRARPSVPAREPMPTIDVEAVDRTVLETKPGRQRIPTLEEQIEAAVAEAMAKDTEEPEAEEPPVDMPPAPEMPEPPEVPPPPEVK